MAKIALLIGVSEYDPGLNPLPGAVKDVDAVKQVLLRPDIGGFVESDVTVLKNPIRQEMEDEIEKLFVSRQKDDLLLLFFSGHGIKDDTGKLYLATRHTRKTSQGELIRSSAVAASFVHENMERSRSKRQVVILDSCFSGAFAEGLSAKDDGSVNIREQLGGEGRAVLTSSSSTQYSFEQEGLDLSIYTHYLIEGITTGEADIDGDGVVSIDELHEYATRKVREIQPAMKPELYAIREGFKIRLTKVPPGDPNEKYAKEVRRYVSRGNVSFVGRKILDAQRISLGLSEVEARAIEDEILAVARQEFREKLQRYEQDFTEAIQQEIPLSEADIDSLRQNLKQIWGLRNEDIQPIEAQVKAKIEAYKQHLQQYEQEFNKAMRQEYPLSETTRNRLQQMQQKWELTAENVTSIETRITAKIEAYRQKLQQYEQVFNTATQQEYPLSQEKRNELLQQQQNLGLKAEDIAPIETRITAKIEAYRQKLQQYEQTFNTAIQLEYPLTQDNRNELRQEQQNLGLKAEDIAPIETRITAEIEAYRLKLQQYEQVFNTATQQEYPLSEGKRNQLRQQQQNLGLKAEDIALIETKITAKVEAYQHKLHEYEEVLKQTIQHDGYPLSNEIRDELKRYQGVLELRDEDVARIEVRVTSQDKAIPASDVASIETRLVPQREAPTISVPFLRKPKLLIWVSIVTTGALTFIFLVNLQMSFQSFDNRGNDKYAKGDYKGAIADYNQAIKLNPDYAVAYYDRGWAKKDLGDNQGAIADYNQAIKLNPDYADAYRGRGLAKSNLGDNKGAIADYNQAIKLSPDYAEAYNNRGIAKLNLGDNKGAIADYQKAAELYQKQGKTKDYQDALEQVKRLQ